jgi:dTDP-4-amino-4,6-dideoxygalactose transaminase
MEGLKTHGVQTSIHYPPIHHFQIYHDDWQKRDAPLPLTEEVAAREVTLPLFPTMSDEQVEWVAQAIKETLPGISVQ